jgi:DNA-binding CsgD family transcriptional regulator
LGDALAGQSRVTVLRGEAGVGKSALLAYLSDRVAGWHVARAVGVESEMELAYAGLHQLCAPMLDQLGRLPVPQRDALATVFGRSAGAAPGRFLVGLATLTLFAEVAEQRPLVCLVDDAQWLDHASAQILGFVARRLLAERIAVVCAARTGAGDDVLAGLPELSVRGLGDSDARALLLANVPGSLDSAVFDQIVMESHGNPLALLELPRTWNVAGLAGGFGLPRGQPVAGRIEQSYIRRLQLLPSDTRLLVLTAAAEPLGDPVLLHRAAGTLGISLGAAGPAQDGGLLKLGRRVEFTHPLVRSAAYRSAAAELPIHLAGLAMARLWAGDFADAAALVAEAGSVAAATGGRFVPNALLWLRALQGREADAAAAIEQAAAGVPGVAIYAHWAAAVLYNGLARYEEAAEAARRATSNTFDYHVSARALPELVEAAARAGSPGLARDALERLAEVTQRCGTDVALGVEARSRALLSYGIGADNLYREAIDRLGRTRLRPELARTRLLYGEWLRREGRRADAREQLRAAHHLFSAIGMEAFAERTGRELLATGEKVRKRSPETRDELTPQEEQIARLAREGLSNPEIGAQLFVSARTVEWHLRNVFSKLGIASRRQLRTALPQDGRVAGRT